MSYIHVCKLCKKVFTSLNSVEEPHCYKCRKGYKPILAGNSYGVQFLCSFCDFPKYDTLTFDMKYCWNCGAEIDWNDWEENKKEQI